MHRQLHWSGWPYQRAEADRVLCRAGTNRRCWHSRPDRWVLRLAWSRPQASQTAARLINQQLARGAKCRVRLNRSSKHEEHKAEAALLCGLYSLNLTAGRAMDFHDSCCRSDADCRAISMPAWPPRWAPSVWLSKKLRCTLLHCSIP